MKTWALFAVVLALMTGWVAVQGGKLKAANAEIVRVEGQRDDWKKRATAAEKAVEVAKGLAATATYEDALQCDAESHELFETGRRVGRIEGSAQCPVS